MRIIRYRDGDGQVKYGSQQADGTAREIAGDIFGSFQVTETAADVKKLLAPVTPSGILCIGLNYRRHAAEGGAPIPKWPVLFMKLPSAVQNPGDPIYLPRHLKSHEVDYECELAVVIGRACKNVLREEALDYVLGYTCANDVSARDWQKQMGGASGAAARRSTRFAHWGPRWLRRKTCRTPMPWQFAQFSTAK